MTRPADELDDAIDVPFDVRVPAALAAQVGRAAIAEGVDVHEWVVDALRAALAARRRSPRATGRPGPAGGPRAA